MLGQLVTNSPTYTHTVILSNPATQNPFTIASNGLIDAPVGHGIIGTAGFAWTIDNLGTVITTAPTGFGIYLTAGGTVVNGHSGSSAGLISAGRAGIALDAL